MENQVNISDQNNEQLEQKPINQSVAIQNKPKTNYLMVSTLIFAFILVALTGYYTIGFLEQGRKGAFPSVTKAPTYINPTKKSVTTASTDKMKIYENPTLHYTFQYPSDWEGGGITRPIKIPTEEEYFELNSSDYQLLEAKYGYLYVDKGSQILVDAESTPENSLETLLNNDYHAKENIINTIVDGQPALQYEFIDQMSSGTTTVFIKNGVAYFITFNYANQDERKNRWSIYQNLINTFKAR